VWIRRVLNGQEAVVDTERKIYLNVAEVPVGAKVLGIRVEDPLLLWLSDERPDAETIIYEHRTVYVELTMEEFMAVRGDQEKIDALGREFGPLVQHKLGGSWHRWIEEDES
jgi:hypothetical protein